MESSQKRATQLELLTHIREFVARSGGLRESESAVGTISIFQTVDGKGIAVAASDLDDVLSRVDADGHDFIQVNYRTGQKLLMTDTLIGFKPTQSPGLDMTKLPKVVTTPDIVSIFEAIQEALHGGDSHDDEVAMLRKVYDAVLTGGEAVGFDLARERAWLRRIPSTIFKVTA
ncbi:MAG: hypothetical protein NDI61_07215 [Bdellovibrionaceae bacterium]|nr:hypothetical protein [Pseudobdellovibrionaceae bacterium]